MACRSMNREGKAMDQFKPSKPMPAFDKAVSATPSEPNGPSYDPLLNGPNSRAMVDISPTTEWRWTRDPLIRYPKPDLTINGRHFWRLSTLNKFIERVGKTRKA
jgi:hypothetical protein